MNSFGPDQAQAALDAAMLRFPSLNQAGLTDPSVPRVADPAAVTLPGAEGINASIAFLRLCRPTKMPYAPAELLTRMVDEFGRRNNLASGVSEGALIAAAVFLGFPVRHLFGNYTGIGVSITSVRELMETAKSDRARPC